AWFIAIAFELSTHEIFRLQGFYRLEHFYLFVTDRFAVGADGRFHGKVGQHLEQMILDHVPDGADLIVKRASPLDAKVLRHCDLHTFDIRAVPQWFEHGV